MFLEDTEPYLLSPWAGVGVAPDGHRWGRLRGTDPLMVSYWGIAAGGPTWQGAGGSLPVRSGAALMGRWLPPGDPAPSHLSFLLWRALSSGGATWAQAQRLSDQLSLDH